MINYLFLVLIFLFMAIDIVSSYKFFRLKKFKLAWFTLIYFLITLVLTLSYFSSRNILIEDELTSLINGVSNFNLFAIVVLILNIAMIFISVYGYALILKEKKLTN